MTEKAPAFDISPEVVFRLGDELISDELQALVELVKNSYDASAEKVTVEVNTRSSSGSRPSGKGWLEVRDDGDGMTRDRLEHGWLLISTPGKRDMKAEGRTNRLGRTPLGDKGLGRLGVLRLGAHIEIRTRPRDAEEEHILRFSRADFERETALSDIDLHYERRALKQDERAPGGWRTSAPFRNDVTCTKIAGRQGTVIRVSGLNNTEVWRDRVRLQQEMLSLISPFEVIQDFELDVHLDDPSGRDPLPLGKLADLRRDLAEARWKFSFDGERLKMTGRIKLKAFQPAPNNERLTALWTNNIAGDRGAEYRRRLVEGKLAPYEAAAGEGPWWLTVTLSVDLADVGAPRKTAQTQDIADEPVDNADPGPFSGELDVFSLDRKADIGVGDDAPFETVELYRRWVHDVRGVKVFRDGFGIRVEDDFLGLGKAFTSARGFYALRPGNIVGFIGLTAKHNSRLQETTDREGFVANAAFRTFKALLDTLVARVNLINNQIGRELGDWASEAITEVPDPPSRRAATLAAEAAKRDAQTRETITAVSSIQRTLTELSDGGALLTPPQAREAKKAGETLERLRELVAAGETLRSDLEHLAAEAEHVENERAQLRDQLRVAYQTVGLGIVAETVAHEMNNIVGRLQARVDSVAPQFSGPEYRSVRGLLAEVRTTIRAIRLQLRHLEPQLRYQRMRRQDVDLMALAERTAAYHSQRLKPHGVTIEVAGTPFIARVNQGRVEQALDNLLINSEFWLQNADTNDPRIVITASGPLVTVRDNGPGVDPGLETAIFEPFVSGRSGDEGRGLGLFIARQVLADDDAVIYLGDRDSDGRRRTFVLDFSGSTPEAPDERR
jgi:signal transduction histidine kinase